MTPPPNAETSDEAVHARTPQVTVAELAELVGGLAHELRNPLSTMMVNLKLLAEDLRNGDANFDDVRRRALLKVDVLRQEAGRLQSMFDEFLNLMGPCRLQQQTVDLAVIVNRLVQFFEPLAKSNGIDIRVEKPVQPVRCRADQQLLSQALLNLMINAQEAMVDGGVLRIRLQYDGEHTVLSVIDTGLGIAPENRDRIMRPFFSTKGSGTGLGLSITQRIIREHGGELAFESAPGQGTTFTIRLPRESRDFDAAGTAG